MVRDGGLVALDGVQVAGELRLGCGNLGPAPDGAGAQAEPGGTGDDAQSDARLGGLGIGGACVADGRPHRAQALGEIALDVEVSLDVGPGDAELSGRPHDVPQRALVVDEEDGCALDTRLAAVPCPQPDGEVDAEGVLGQGEEADGDVHRSIELWLVAFRHLNFPNREGSNGRMKS